MIKVSLFSQAIPSFNSRWHLIVIVTVETESLHCDRDRCGMLNRARRRRWSSLRHGDLDRDAGFDRSRLILCLYSQGERNGRSIGVSLGFNESVT